MNKLLFYNTLHQSKERFIPINKNIVGLYTCGPTVYNYAHLGNLRTYLFEDLLKRTLLFNGYKVTHVENITDVGHLTDDADQGEDKMEKAAIKQKKSAWELANFYTDAFRADLKKLNILEPDIWCKATDHIDLQIETIKKIELNGFTYQTNDGIYFDTSKLPDYGKLARLDKERLQAGKRVEMGEKRNPTDFALWKFSPKHEKRQMEWDSPWGKGFPGWHIECSAMSSHFLGVPFDIHCGGIDHIPVHHTNEIAQTEAAEQKELANFWMHGEFMIIDDKRMGKSEGNFITLQTAVKKGFEPLAFRYLTLNTHYRQKLNFTWEALQGAQNALDNLRLQLIDLPLTKAYCESFVDDFTKAINDDLNTPQAIALTWDLIKSECPGEMKLTTILKFDEILGLDLKHYIQTAHNMLKHIPQAVTNLLQERNIARKEKDWGKSDELRDKIFSFGYVVEDTVNGQKLLPNQKHPG